MQRQLRAIQTQGEIIIQSAFLKHALLQPGDDLGIHAAVMVARDIGNTLAHAVG